MRHHAALLTRAYWQSLKERILAGEVEDVFPYPQAIRFCHQRQANGSAQPSLRPTPYLETHNNE
jgi:isocitrate dehydrogenase kinase/phosphatase